MHDRGFQRSWAVDYDRGSEDEGMGLTKKTIAANSANAGEGCLIFLEVIRDYHSSSPPRNQPESWIVAHEIDHMFVYSSSHESDGSLLDDGGDITNSSFNNDNLSEIRGTLVP